MADIVDLRSDTVTQPTIEMRKAMEKAEVGDDVFGEDPTINRLQKLAAERMGKEAGLFVASGTMGNLVAILAHCNRGDEAIMGSLGHTFLFEGGGVSALGGVMVHTLPNQPDGTLKLDDLRNAIRPNDPHQPISRLLILENTHNRCGGVYLTPEDTNQAADFCRENHLSFHLDGARIFNASVAQGIPASTLAWPADSVTFCLSKGLCAPVGSVLCGSEEFIARARRIRKQVGGGMRQAGILAAAGIVALDSMIDRLTEDHRRAQHLAGELANVPGLKVEYHARSTNMVFAQLEEDYPDDAPQIAREIAKYSVLVMASARRRFRMVTHYWINDESIERTVAAFKQVMTG